VNKAEKILKVLSGKRGEGWVILQVFIFLVIGLSVNYVRVNVPLWLRICALISLLTGGMLGTLGVLYLGKNLTPFPKPKYDTQLIRHGIFRMVRHPIYSGLIFGTFGWSLFIGSLPGMILSIILFLFFDLKSRREESWLTERFPEYKEYQKRVKKLIPFIY
jgi:protein-S-isoprenylcysteine O-methyltransferase Ste14